MKTFILSENGIDRIKRNIIMEAEYSDHVKHGKDYLNGNYMRAEYDNNGNIVGVFVKLSNGKPTQKTVWKQDVLDDLDKEFYNRITDDKERKGFINQLLDNWYNNKISKYDTLTNYNF